MSFFSCFIKFSIISFLSFNLPSHANEFASATIIIDSYNHESSKIKLGLLVNLQPGWHIYWKNPGDSGMPTRIEFSIPEGFSISEIKFPVPNTFEFEGLVSYGYEREVVFIAEINSTTKTKYSEKSFSVKLKSLICKELCIPFDTTINFTINLNKEFIPSREISDLFSYTNLQLPIYDPNIKLEAKLKSELLSIYVNNFPVNKDKIKSVYFLPYENGYFLNSIQQKTNWAENYFELIVDLDPFRKEIPKEVFGIIVFERDENKFAYEIKIPIIKNTNN